MNQYVVAIDHIKGVNLGQRIIVEGNTPFEAMKNRYPWMEIIEVQRGEEFDIELIRIEVDRFNRTFLKVEDRFWYKISERSYNFIIENPTILLQMDFKIDKIDKVTELV